MKPVRHITVTINVPPLELGADFEDEELDQNQGEATRDDSSERDKHAANSKHRQRFTAESKSKRNTKRMKLTQPNLDVISEVQSVAETEPAGGHRQLEASYSRLLSDVSHTHDRMVEHTKKAVALLKQTNYGQRRKNQMALVSYAKRKLRKLPPISTDPPTFRYSNGNHKDAQEGPLYPHIKVE